MNYYDKYKRYKAKYKLVAGNKDYGEAYLESVANRDCDKIKKYEKLLGDVYYQTRDNYLLNRKLFLYPQDFGGGCGEFWKEVPNVKGSQWVDVVVGSKRATDSSPLPERLFKDYRQSLGIIQIGLIRDGRALLLQNQALPNLFCLLLDKKDYFFKLLYLDPTRGTLQQDVEISNTDVDGDPLPTDPTIFKIRRELNKSTVIECHIDYFFYSTEADPKLRQQIIDLLKKDPHPRFKHWTNWLLGSILNVFFNCLNCLQIHLLDASRFKRLKREGLMQCDYSTLIYQTAKNLPGFYQNIGFRANPPIDIQNLKEIMQLKPSPVASKVLQGNPNDIYIEKKDQHQAIYYQNIETDMVKWRVDYGKIIHNLDQLIPIDTIENYLKTISTRSDSLELLDKLKEKQVFDYRRKQEVVTLNDWVDWSIHNNIPIKPKFLVLDSNGYNELDKILIQKEVCKTCGIKINSNIKLTHGTRVLINIKGEGEGVIIQLESKPSHPSMDYYLVKRSEPSPYQSPEVILPRSSLRVLECPTCKTYSKRFNEKDLAKYYLLNESQIDTYVSNYKSYWKSMNEYTNIYTREWYEKNTDQLLKLFKHLKSVQMGNDPQLLFHYRDFINWHGKAFSRQFFPSSSTVDVPKRILAEPIKTNLLKPLLPPSSLKNFIATTKSDCVCPYCYTINPSLIEKLTEQLLFFMKNHTESDLQKRNDLLRQLQPHLTKMDRFLKKKKVKSYLELVKTYKPDWKHLTHYDLLEFKIKELNRWYIINTVIGNKTICLIPIYLNKEVLDKKHKMKWCQGGPGLRVDTCIECGTPLTGIPSDAPSIPIVDNSIILRKSALTQIKEIDPGDYKKIITLPVQPKLNIDDTIEVRFKIRGSIEHRFYLAVVVGYRLIPRNIIGPYQNCRQGPDTNTPTRDNKESVKQYWIKYTDEDHPKWILLSNQNWRRAGIDWNRRMESR